MNKKYLNKNIIGADETGVGDYLTPLVVAAAFVPFQNVNKLLNLGIVDSKKLNDKKILFLFSKIKPLIKSSVRIMSQRQYNFLNKKYNANELKMYLHLQAISAVEKRVDKVDLIILDAFSNVNSLEKYRKKIVQQEKFEDFKKNIEYLEKAESIHVSVAAASIVARAYFIELMKSQDLKWNMHFPLGTNNLVENFARKFVEKHGEKNLYDVAKLSFKTTKKILK